MKYFKLSLLTFGVLSSFMAPDVSAAGLGRMNIYSGLGQPLNAEIEIIATPQELQTMSAQLASPSAFANAGVQFADALKNNQVYFQIVKKNNGKSYLKLTSNKRFHEPFLDFLVELNWSSGKLVREYTFLLNPVHSAIQSPTAENSSANNFHENYQNSFGDAVAESDDSKINAALNEARANLNIKYQQTQQQIRNNRNQNQNQDNENGENGENGKNGDSANSFADNDNNNASSYLVKNGDTLRQIAERVQQENPNVTLEQMLFAIYQNNPNAFIGKDINKLKSGVNLQIPSEAQVAQMISPTAARRSYRQQSAVWANYRKKLANQTAAINANNIKNNNAKSSQSVQGKITPEVVENQPKNIANQQDKLKISTTENASVQTNAGISSGKSKNNKNSPSQFDDLQQQINDLKNRADAAELDRFAKEQALQESESRVKELEKNVEDLSNLLAIKNQQLANLEQISSANANANANQQTQPKPQQQPPQQANPQVEPQPQIEPQQQPKSDEMAPVEKPKKPKIQPKLNDGEEIFDKGDEKDLENEEASFIDKNLGTIGGSLMILSLLGAGIMFLLKKKRKLEEQHNEPENSATDTNIAENNNENLVENVSDANADANVEAEQANETPSDNENDNDSENTENFLDPLQEAQNYIDANQYDKAEEILLNAFNQDTTNIAFMAKLLEIYAHQNNTERFENIARQLQNIVGNDSEDWIQTKALGHQIDPTNPLYLDEVAEDNPADDLLNSLDDTDGFTQPKPDNNDLGMLAEEPSPELGAEPEMEASPELDAVEEVETENADENNESVDGFLNDDDDDEPIIRKSVEEAHLESAVDSAVLPQEGSVRTDMVLDFDSLDSAEDNQNEEAAEEVPQENSDDLLDNLKDFSMEQPEEQEPEIPVVEEIPKAVAEEENLENSENLENLENLENSEDLNDFHENSENIFEEPAEEIAEDVTENESNELSDELSEHIAEETQEIAEENQKENLDENLAELAMETEPEPEPKVEPKPEQENNLDAESDDSESLFDMEEEAPLNEAETKFELAKAYEEMGDLEGAMDLWNELLMSQDASPEIIQQAREHLDKLSAGHPQDDGDDVSKLL